MAMATTIDFATEALRIHLELIETGELTVKDIVYLSPNIINYPLYDWYRGNMLHAILLRMTTSLYNNQNEYLDQDQMEHFINAALYLCDPDSGCDMLMNDYYDTNVVESFVYMMKNELLNRNIHAPYIAEVMHDILVMATLAQLYAKVLLVFIKFYKPIIAYYKYCAQVQAATIIQQHYRHSYWKPPCGKGYQKLMFKFKTGIYPLPSKSI